MSDVSADPFMSLSEHPQDAETAPPRARLGDVLALLRILAGVRGHSALRWSGAGYTYALSVRRGLGPDVPTLDVDSTAERRGEARSLLLDALAHEER